MFLNSQNYTLEYMENIIDTVRESLIVLDSDLRIISANRSFYKKFMVTEEEIEREILFNIGNGQWSIPELKDLLEKILPQRSFFNDFEVELDLDNIGKRIMYLNARKMLDSRKDSVIILLAIEDVTDRINAERDLEKKNRELELALLEIKTLKGIVPICSFCKKIRNDMGYWEQVEVYVHNHSDADFSHSVCPECLKENYPDFEVNDKESGL